MAAKRVTVQGRAPFMDASSDGAMAKPGPQTRKPLRWRGGGSTVDNPTASHCIGSLAGEGMMVTIAARTTVQHRDDPLREKVTMLRWFRT